jgi:VanZ family protein
MERVYLWPPALALCLFFASGSSELATPEFGLSFSPDKLGHFLLFGLLATSILRIPAIHARGWRGAWIAVVLTFTYGAVDEWRQSLTPGRAVELYDLLADLLGAIVAVIVYRAWPTYRNCLEWAPFQRRRQRAHN